MPMGYTGCILNGVIYLRTFFVIFYIKKGHITVRLNGPHFRVTVCQSSKNIVILLITRKSYRRF